jgi:hypothetical protein
MDVAGGRVREKTISIYNDPVNAADSHPLMREESRTLVYVIRRPYPDCSFVITTALTLFNVQRSQQRM